jgi:hypothetical protein
MAAKVAVCFVLVGMCAANPLPISFKGKQPKVPPGWKLGTDAALGMKEQGGIELLYSAPAKWAGGAGGLDATSTFHNLQRLKLAEASMKVEVVVDGKLDNTDNSTFAFWVKQFSAPQIQPTFVSNAAGISLTKDWLGFAVLFSKFKGSEAIKEHLELSVVVNRELGEEAVINPEGCKVGDSILPNETF